MNFSFREVSSVLQRKKKSKTRNRCDMKRLCIVKNMWITLIQLLCGICTILVVLLTYVVLLGGFVTQSIIRTVGSGFSELNEFKRALLFFHGFGCSSNRPVKKSPHSPPHKSDSVNYKNRKTYGKITKKSELRPSNTRQNQILRLLNF